MTVEQFATLDPGFGTMMLFHIGNTVSALNIDNASCNLVNVSAAIEEIEKITLTIGEETYTTDVTLVVTYTGYYHLRLDPIEVSSTEDIPQCTVTSMYPGIRQVNFSKSEYQALKNNASQASTTSFIFDVDRRNTQLRPQNYRAIISGSATPAQYQELNYSSIGLNSSRYGGSKTSDIEYGISPAISGTPFQAASYLSSSNNDFICSQSLSDRDIELYLFDGTTETPVQGNSVFTIEGSRILPIKNKKVWVKDSREILYLDNNGTVESVTLCS